MTTTKNHTAHKKGKSKATAQSRRRRLDAEVDYFNEHFPVDLQTAQSLVAHITAEEFCYLVGRCGQKKYFAPALLRVLGRANKRRDERLHKLLDYSLPELLRDQPRSISEPFAVRIRQRIDRYDGPGEFAPLAAWILSEAEFYVAANNATHDSYVQNAREFLILHSAGRDALLGGIRKGLASCLELGADLGDKEQPGDTVCELEQRAWLKVWRDLPAWVEPGPATISTRLFTFGLWQARAWKTERLRDRNRMVRGLFDARDDEDEDERQAA